MGWSDAGPLLALVDELVTSLSQQQVTIDQPQQAIVQLREQNQDLRLLQRSQKAMPQLRAPALQIPVAGLDETGLRVADRTAWLPVICHQDLTDYRLGGRGEVWADYASVAVHDRFASYWNRRPKVTAHTLCHVHLLPNRQEIVAQEQAPDGCTRPAPMPAIPTSWSRGPSWRHNGQR